MKKILLLILALNFNFVTFGEITSPGESIFPPHMGDSEASFTKFGTPSDTFIVSDIGVDNDNYKPRDDSVEYDLVFPLRISRYIGDAGNLQKLLQNKLISEKFTLIIPAFDVDDVGSNEFFDCDSDGINDLANPEVDEVYVNGVLIDTLTGENNKWEINIFPGDISILNFPENPGDAAKNFIQIKLDTANKNFVNSSGSIGCQRWATTIDYVALKFEVVDPVFFAVGLFNSDGLYGLDDYKMALEDLGMLVNVVDNSKLNSALTTDLDAIRNLTIPCSTRPSSTYKDHGSHLKNEILKILSDYGSDSFNIIGYSKGGLDARYVVNDFLWGDIESVTTSYMNSSLLSRGEEVINRVRPNSFISHGTPYGGTVFADELANQYIVNNLLKIAGGSFTNSLTTTLRSKISDICDISTHEARKFTRDTIIANYVPYLVINGDIDANDNNIVDVDENIGNRLPLSYIPVLVSDSSQPGSGYNLAQFSYDALKNGSFFGTKEVAVSCSLLDQEFFPHRCTRTVVVLAGVSSVGNDTQVTIESGVPYDADKSIIVDANHGTIISPIPSTGNITAVDIAIDEGLNGFLEWTVK